MHLKTFRVRNYRRLKQVRVDLDQETTIFVGANNSGKTSATHIFQAFLGTSNERFSIHDFSCDCWETFNRIGAVIGGSDESLPSISLDLWFSIDDSDLHRVISILPGLDWKDTPVGIRLEYAAKDSASLLASFRDAREKSAKFSTPADGEKDRFHPWPELLSDYLKKRLSDEYRINYYVLDYGGFTEEYEQKEGYRPSELGTAAESGAKLLSSLIRVDFLTAQRHLADSESKGKAEDLSKRLSRFYERNLEKHDDDFKAVAALAHSEAMLNVHLKAVFAPTLKNLNELGYPGFTEPHLVIKSAFNPESILTKNASVHYALNSPSRTDAGEQSLTLPDKYNGLGFKNLIYMVIEILDFHERWADEEENRPPLHLIVIEEPEAHLHAQLQQVFIRKIRDILPKESPLFNCQLVITTHSPHIIYESSFKPIRYFRRSTQTNDPTHSTVLNLSQFYESEKEYREFITRYMKLTHCDLFFADGAILVEGNVERLLMPLMIEKAAPELRSCYLSILELGGAFAHIFKTLIQFLGITTLIITDLDSVLESPTESTTGKGAGKRKKKENEEDESDDDEKLSKQTCMANVPLATTSNPTLSKWLPRLTLIEELLTANPELKAPLPAADAPAKICIAYQSRTTVAWGAETIEIAGRTFEEAFAFQNLGWCQDLKRKHLGLRVVTKTTEKTKLIGDVAQSVHDRVKGDGFDKTRFALGLMMTDETEWSVPAYIADGLDWLSKQMAQNLIEESAADLSAAPKEAIE